MQKEVFAVRARNAIAYGPSLPKGVMEYDPMLPISSLPKQANIWVDILAPRNVGVDNLFGETVYRTFGQDVHGPGSDMGEALFQSHALLTLFYPELVERLGEIMPIYECQIGVDYFQSPQFKEAHKDVSTVGDAQQYLIDQFTIWGQELGVQVTPLTVAPRLPQSSLV